MFRDLKEYQEIAKIYAEKVSKSENLEEMGPLGTMPKLSGRERAQKMAKDRIAAKAKTDTATVKKSEINKIDPKQFDNRRETNRAKK